METVCVKVQGTITCETPVHIGTGETRGIIKASKTYVPGSIIRGAFGVMLSKTVCKMDKVPVDHSRCEYAEECLYMRLFPDGNRRAPIFFRHAYPKHFVDGKAEGTLFPAPRTMFQCEDEKCKTLFNTFRLVEKCRECRGKVRPYIGYVCASCGKTAEPVKMTRITSTAIDRRLCSAAVTPPERPEELPAGTLHTIDAIERGTMFDLQVVLDGREEDQLPLVIDLLENGLPDEGIGGSKSRGLGKVAVRVEKTESVTRDVVVRRSKEIDSCDFTVRVLTTTVLEEPLIQPRTLLASARSAYTWVIREDAPKLPEVSLRDYRVAHVPFSGWSLKENRRRPLTTAAIASGSVFRYASPVKSEKLAIALAALELRALGNYKPYGCGQLAVEGPR